MNNELIYKAFRGEATASELAELHAWRSASEEHEEHYRQVIGLLQFAATTPPLVRLEEAPTAVEIIARADSSRESPKMPRGDGSAPQRQWWWPAIAAAALVTLSLGIADLKRPSGDTPRFGADEIVTTGLEPTTVRLNDGTVVRLAPNSRFRVSSASGDRLVTLHGRAYLNVANHPGSSFIVQTAAGDAVVLGTRFQVDSWDDEMTVVVVEGRVALRTPVEESASIEVEAGEQSQIISGNISSPVRVEDVDRIVAWAGRVLVFDSTPLEAVAAELERQYGASVKIADRTVAARTISGTFVDLSLNEVVDVVCAAVGARCTAEGNAIRIASHARGAKR